MAVLVVVVWITVVAGAPGLAALSALVPSLDRLLTTVIGTAPASQNVRIRRGISVFRRHKRGVQHPSLEGPPAVAPKSYGPHTSASVRRLTANLIALGDAWRGTAPPIRLLGWTVATVVATACVVVAAKLGVVSPGIETLLTYTRSW